ncbi:MAG TPA: glycoside hydrolase family 15 protein [Candidatus Thermoplasmatota archaeon]|nr:glycoside hydrolase family 15 protein [Candidatus Thermoplasmatota archaeon]
MLSSPVSLSMQASVSRYRPIADYGAIGEGRSIALVGSNGSIDWWSPGRFDAPSIFAAILDANAGGHYRVSPTGQADSRMSYVDETNVLETVHATSTGRVRVRDLMPFAEDTGVNDNIIMRRVTGLEGAVEMEAVFAPRFQYGRVFPRFTRVPVGIMASGGGEIVLLRSPLQWSRPEKGVRRAVFTVQAGETVDLVLRHEHFASPVPFPNALATPDAALEERAIARWQEWSAGTSFEGPDAPLVRRSALALKLLQYRRNGAFVAAGTTSLPEGLGGVRNWDYRFTWVRDGALTAKALKDLGHHEEAAAFAGWLQTTIGTDVDAMRIMYTLSGSSELPERELPHLEGYEKSAPVRIGNAAVHQRQLDVYGELVEFLHLARSSESDRSSWPLVRAAADWVVEHWREPDQGIWEMRCEPRHFVLSKAMAWAALHRAEAFAQALGEPVPEAWTREAALIRDEVFAQGYDAGRRSFVQAYGFPALDASNLLLPLIGFVDAKDPRMMETVDRTLEELTVDGLVYRYLADDGLPGGEATFAYCTFWLVEVMAMQGRVREARALFDRMAKHASPLGLYAEEIDAANGLHLGNYPQAFPHVGLIQAARQLRAAERGEPPVR